MELTNSPYVKANYCKLAVAVISMKNIVQVSVTKNITEGEYDRDTPPATNGTYI